MSAVPKKPIDFKATMAIVDSFTKDNNIPTKSYPALVTPAPAQNPTISPSAGQGGQQSNTPARVKRPLKKCTFELPQYLVDELFAKAKRPLTMRHLVMQALKNDGYTIHDEDLSPDYRRTDRSWATQTS